MSISARNREKWSSLTADDKDRIVRMAWEDRTAFDAIKEQFQLTPNEVVKFMRTQLDEKAYKRWRRRANEQGHLKHEMQRPFVEGRFKCRRQRSDGSTKGWK
ncbi:TIGR03643 family protein [Bdellovibrio svalbardensis]|uniref:TIGR03643 family protein n=1 Tax=Bdellovibrio svalbardensis TaxID=2972972 RepID=A0ABT6DL26_9BACT|nr:TIGR03643 family protein [Bdellovibrio svalbardensis]MDG0817574.1 TIGR03643 family protein [Bdellovibrio svalbardensis]